MKVGIVGCGIAGLAAASLLSTDGHDVEILERAPTPEPIGAGLLLQPPGAAVLAELGILNPVAHSASIVTRLDSRTASGRRLLDLDYADLAPGLHGLGLRRPAIWSALFERALSDGVPLHAGISVSGVHSAADVAIIETDAGARTYDLAIVASGTHSSIATGTLVRHAKPYPWGCLWTTIALPADWPQNVLQQRCLGSRIMIGILPTGVENGQPTAALYWSVRNDQAEAWRDQPIERWFDLVSGIWPEALPLLSGLRHEDFQHGTYRDVWANPPYRGRVLMIGDIAHGTSPQLGQGVTQALRDASALTRYLRRDAPLEAKLADYWRERKRSVAYYRSASRLLTPAFQSNIPGLAMLRDVFAGSMNDIFKGQALLTLAGMKTGYFSSDAALLGQSLTAIDDRSAGERKPPSR